MDAVLWLLLIGSVSAFSEARTAAWPVNTVLCWLFEDGVARVLLDFFFCTWITSFVLGFPSTSRNSNGVSSWTLSSSIGPDTWSRNSNGVSSWTPSSYMGLDTWSPTLHLTESIHGLPRSDCRVPSTALLGSSSCSCVESPELEDTVSSAFPFTNSTQGCEGFCLLRQPPSNVFNRNSAQESHSSFGKPLIVTVTK